MPHEFTTGNFMTRVYAQYDHVPDNELEVYLFNEMRFSHSQNKRTRLQKMQDAVLYTKEYREENQEYINKFRPKPKYYGAMYERNSNDASPVVFLIFFSIVVPVMYFLIRFIFFAVCQ